MAPHACPFAAHFPQCRQMKSLTLNNRLHLSSSGAVFKLASWLLPALMQANVSKPAESARQGLQSHATVDDWGDETDPDWGEETAVSDPVEADAGENPAQVRGRRLAAMPTRHVLQLSYWLPCST